MDINHGEAFDTVEELQAIEEYIKWYNIERI
ncbi:IS3 family transposase [Corynebacterium sp. LaCa7]